MAEDTQWTFQVPAGTFDDIDSTGLTYTAILGNGATLPFWLTFDVSTRTFSGTPPRDFNGSLDLKITASDGSLSAFDIFTLTIDPVNDAPVVRAPVVDATILEEAPWTFQVPAGTFEDVDNSLSYTATLANGTALPSWLAFDLRHALLRYAASGFQRHRRPQGDRKRRRRLSDTFTLNIMAVDNPPVLAPITDQTVAEDTPWSFRVPANAFIDSDSSGLIYTASLADGSPLPQWLHFDDETETFSGIPPLNFTGSIDLKVIAKDATSEMSYVQADRSAGQRRACGSADRRPERGGGYSLDVPGAGRCVLGCRQRPLTYTATLSDGSALPAWLTFDALTRTFSGTPPADATDTIDLTVVASDGSFSASDTFRLTVTPVNDAPVAGTPIGNQSIAEDTAWTFQVPARHSSTWTAA